VLLFLLSFVLSSLHASIITAVDVVSLSNAYCFICLRVFGNSHVVFPGHHGVSFWMPEEFANAVLSTLKQHGYATEEGF
jgi:hypothetical protein